MSEKIRERVQQLIKTDFCLKKKREKLPHFNLEKI